MGEFKWFYIMVIAGFVCLTVLAMTAIIVTGEVPEGLF